MAVQRSRSVDDTELQPLTLSELEGHLEEAAAEIARGAETPSLAGDDDDSMPRPISSAEFVRRMSRFVVFN